MATKSPASLAKIRDITLQHDKALLPNEVLAIFKLLGVKVAPSEREELEFLSDVGNHLEAPAQVSLWTERVLKAAKHTPELSLGYEADWVSGEKQPRAKLTIPISGSSHFVRLEKGPSPGYFSLTVDFGWPAKAEDEVKRIRLISEICLANGRDPSLPPDWATETQTGVPVGTRCPPGFRIELWEEV